LARSSQHRISIDQLNLNRRAEIAYTKLNIDREVVEVGSNLLLDGLTTGLGGEVDISLDSG